MIQDLFTPQEQKEIALEVSRRSQKQEETGIPKTRRFGFSNLAERYGLVKRIEQELETAKRNPSYVIATDGEIAGLFGVQRSAVQFYLSSRLNGNKESRSNLCLSIGRKRAYDKLVKSGKLYKLNQNN